MFTKIIYIIIYLVCTISLSQIFLLGSYLIGKKELGSIISKNTLASVFPLIYQNGFNTTMYYNGLYKKTNKIDIIIANHLNTSDFMINVSIIRQYDDRDIYCIFKKELLFIPSGIILAETDIILNRKIEDDIENIIKSIKNIKSGIILMFPEGTRYTQKKHTESMQYSIDNNLTVYNNLLYPKMKGLWTLYNILLKEKRLGNIIDITSRIENLKNVDGGIFNILKYNFGNTFTCVNSYIFPVIKEYDDFKKWFLRIWDKKESVLDNILTKNDNIIYKKLKINIKSSEYILLIFIITLFIFVCVKTNGLYLLFSLIISYILSFIKYKSISK